MYDKSHTRTNTVLTSTQVGTLDTAPVTLETFRSDSSLGYLPMRLLISKPAGTAWTLGSPARLEIYDEDGNIWFSVPSAGFLDQATAQGRMMLANLKSVNQGNTTINIRSQGTLTGGSVGFTVRMEVEVEALLFA